MRRDDMRRSFGQFRFSPRPRSSKSVRKFSWTGVDGLHRERRRPARDARRRTASSRSSSRTAIAFSVGYDDIYEFLPRAVPHRARRRRCRSAATTSPACASATTSASSGACPGNVSLEHGTFYSGHKTALSVSRGRVNLTPQLSVEPSISVNWVDLRGGLVHDAPGRLARDLHDDAADVRERAAAVQLRQQRRERQRAPALGVPARQRAVRRLQRAARHAGAAVSRRSPTARSSSRSIGCSGSKARHRPPARARSFPIADANPTEQRRGGRPQVSLPSVFSCHP